MDRMVAGVPPVVRGARDDSRKNCLNKSVLAFCICTSTLYMHRVRDIERANTLLPGSTMSDILANGNGKTTEYYQGVWGLIWRFIRERKQLFTFHLQPLRASYSILCSNVRSDPKDQIYVLHLHYYCRPNRSHTHRHTHTVSIEHTYPRRIIDIPMRMRARCMWRRRHTHRCNIWHYR